MENASKLLGLLFLAVVTVAAPARAQTAPPASSSPASSPPASPPTAAAAGEAAHADALFQEGKRLLEQGKTDAACTLLAQGDAEDPTVGTLGLLAACHEQQGRLATASREYRETARRAAAAGDSRGDFARERAAALEPRLHRLVIRLAGPTADVEILRNGVPVPAAEVGVAIPVDPGSYEIVARAPGRRSHRAVVVVAAEGVAVPVDVPELALVAPPPPPLRVAPAAPQAPVASAAQGSGARRPAGFILSGMGVAGLGIGIGFGVSALESNLQSKKLQGSCKMPGAAPGDCAAGQALRSSAFTAATASTVGLLIGAGGLGAGLALILWPSGARPTSGPARTALVVVPITGPQGGGAALGGSF